jgi:hypothetical protein
MTFDKIEFSPTQPGRIDVVWAKPVIGGGFALYLNYNGKWQPMKVMKDAGTDTPDDDKPYDLDVMGATKLSELEDVSLNSLTNGQILKYKGESWENEDDDSGTPGPDSVGTAQIIDNSVIMDDLNDSVKDIIQKTYHEDDEALHMDYDIADQQADFDAAADDGEDDI